MNSGSGKLRKTSEEKSKVLQTIKENARTFKHITIFTSWKYKRH